ncbi:hypothetical protein EB75_15755 [Mycobacterium sp. ST-F2]|uniref:hypothetical protein n=1 Tax=Mycobacterium sp. ST-F2 TaxID=1490484 RepID=UPI000938CEFA|nr:hypothetical protein [Mycobacterium sp. ST-F2]OKH85746.1 hypothetical protein EB75_15755 [Mycobacterium sp. ST-F2]
MKKMAVAGMVSGALAVGAMGLAAPAPADKGSTVALPGPVPARPSAVPGLPGPVSVYPQYSVIGGADPYVPFGPDPSVPYGVWVQN